MFSHEGLNMPVATDLAPRIDGQLLKRARAFYTKVFEMAAAISEPFGGKWEITILDPKVRSGMSGREQGVSSADFHGV